MFWPRHENPWKLSTVEPHYAKLGYLEHPTISNCFSLPLAQINPCYLKLYYVPKKHWSKSVRECSQGTSWQYVLKSEKRIDVFTVTKAKSDWLDLLLWMQKATSCRVLVHFRDQTITPEIWRQPRYLEPPLSRTTYQYPWEFEIAGFFCTCNICE